MRFEGVSVKYGQTRALDKVSFAIEPGELVVLSGPSGAGKTTILRLIAMEARPDGGAVTVLGASPKGRTEIDELRDKVGVVFQDLRLLEHMNVFENVALPLRVRGQKREDYADNVMELLDWVGLAERAHEPAKGLSVGESQRVAIARAVVTRPLLILADEPTAHLDDAAAKRLLRLFVELNRLGATVIVASHDVTPFDMDKARHMKLFDGRVVAGAKR